MVRHATWNARGELTTIAAGSTTTAAYGYDPVGRRTAKTISGATTGFAYNGSTAIQEKTGGTVSANSIVGGTDQILSRTDSAGARSYLTDGLDSTLALVDGSGVIKTSYAYTPYGATSASGAATTNPVQYAGRENDANGLYYYRARYYNPTYGRFISEDPLGLAAGSNLYRYAADDPVDLNDPSGMILPIVAACAVGAAINVGLDLFFNFLSGRKTTLGGLLFSAAVGCGAGVAGLGLGKALSWALGKIGPEVAVLGRLAAKPSYAQLAEWFGSKGAAFNIPRAIWDAMSDAERWAANKEVLDQFILDGTPIQLSTNAWTTDATGTFWRELQYMYAHGYTISDNGWTLISPK